MMMFDAIQKWVKDRKYYAVAKLTHEVTWTDLNDERTITTFVFLENAKKKRKVKYFQKGFKASVKELQVWPNIYMWLHNPNMVVESISPYVAKLIPLKDISNDS